jgi:hypothetical protein
MDLFTLVPVFIGIIFVIVLFIFVIALFAVVKAIVEWQHNNMQPNLSVASRIIAKRTQVSKHLHLVGTTHSVTTSTYYFCTFEDEHGQRYEFRISGKEYGQLVEGDLGTLTYQGTRYHGFQRQTR